MSIREELHLKEMADSYMLEDLKYKAKELGKIVKFLVEEIIKKEDVELLNKLLENEYLDKEILKETKAFKKLLDADYRVYKFMPSKLSKKAISHLYEYIFDDKEKVKFFKKCKEVMLERELEEKFPSVKLVEKEVKKLEKEKIDEVEKEVVKKVKEFLNFLRKKKINYFYINENDEILDLEKGKKYKIEKSEKEEKMQNEKKKKVKKLKRWKGKMEIEELLHEGKMESEYYLPSYEMEGKEKELLEEISKGSIFCKKVEEEEVKRYLEKKGIDLKKLVSNLRKIDEEKIKKVYLKIEGKKFKTKEMILAHKLFYKLVMMKEIDKSDYYHTILKLQNGIKKGMCELNDRLGVVVEKNRLREKEIYIYAIEKDYIIVERGIYALEYEEALLKDIKGAIINNAIIIMNK